MPEPIIEQVAAAMLTRVATVTTANGYFYTLDAIRPGRRNANPRHLGAEVWIESPEPVGLSEGNGVIQDIDWNFAVVVYVANTNDDDTPLDRYLTRVWADVVKAVALGYAQGAALDLLAWNWRVNPPLFDVSDEFDVVIASFTATVRTSESDPYTQR